MNSWTLRLQRMESMLSVIEACCQSISYGNLGSQQVMDNIETPYRHASDIADQLECDCQGPCHGFYEEARKTQARAIELQTRLQGCLCEAREREFFALQQIHGEQREKLKEIASTVAGKPCTEY